MFTHMDYIYEVYQERSFSKAAAKLYISQSSLSLTIKRAEEKIGMQIFDRSSYPIRLTEFGSLYITAVEEIRTITSSLNDYIYDVNHLMRGNIAIGSGNFYATYLAAPAILSFKKQYPNISAQLQEGRTLELEQRLANGDIDVLITNGTLNENLYNKHSLFTEQMILVVPRCLLTEPLYPEYSLTYEDLADGKAADKPGVPLKAYEHLPFIGMRQGNDSRIRMDKILGDSDCFPQLVIELDQSSTTFRLANEGMGACIVADTVICKLGAQSDMFLYRIDHPQAQRDVAVYTKKTEYTARVIDTFIQILKKQM